MILFRDWTITSDGLLARQYDNLSRRVEVVGELPEGWTWELLVQVGDALDIIPLTSMAGGVGHTLTAEQVSLDGYYTVQLRGRNGEIIKHTNTTQAFVSKSLSGTAQWPSIPSEFTELEQRMWELNNHPPKPGEDGYWLLWDADRDEYVTSDIPLPEGTGGGTQGAVLYFPQNLNEAEQGQARSNIGAPPKTLVVDIDVDGHSNYTPAQIAAHVSAGGYVTLGAGSGGKYQTLVYAEKENAVFFSLDVESSAISSRKIMILEDGSTTIVKTPYKPDLTAEDVGAIPADQLPDAINTALEQAKESGEFDGPAYELTEADKQEIVNATLAALPVYHGEVEDA